MNVVRLAKLLCLSCFLSVVAFGQGSGLEEMPWLGGPGCLVSAPEGEAGRHFEAAQSYEKRGDYARALTEYQKASSAALEIGSCLSLVKLYLRINELAAAESTALVCNRIEERNICAQLSLAFILQEQDKLQQAEKIVQTVLDTDSRNPYAWYLLGKSYLASNDLVPAEEYLSKSIELDPSHAYAHLALGSLYRQNESTLETAEELLEKALELGLETSEVHRELGAVKLSLIQKREEEAVRHLEDAVRLNPLAVEAYYLLSRAYRRVNWPKHAQQALERYQELQAKTRQLNEEVTKSQSLYQNGMHLLMKNQPDQALAEFRAALGAHPNVDICHYGIAQALMRKGDVDGAIEAVRKAIESRPYEFGYHYFLAQALHRRQRYIEAIQAVEQAIFLKPSGAELYNYLGNLYFELGDDRKALAAYQHAVQLDHTQPLFHLNLSSVLMRMGREEEGAREQEVYRRLLAQERPK